MGAAAPVSVDDVIAWVKAQSTPATLRVGSPHPTVLVAFDGVAWTLHPLRVPHDVFVAERDRRLAAGKPFMAEHAAALAVADDAVCRAATAERFVEQLRALTWTPGGPAL